MTVKNKIIVNSDFYGGNQGIDNILNDYYEREIQGIGDKVEQEQARIFIEEGLIIEGNRVSVSEAGALAQFDLSEDLLLRLRRSRLIRAENTHLGKAYEVSHDTLVPPILKSLQKRKEEEARIEVNKKLEEEHLAFQQEKKKKRRALLLAAFGFVLFFIALIALFYAYKFNEKAILETKNAKASELTAHSIFETQTKLNVTRGYGLAKAAIETLDNTESRKGLFSTFHKAGNKPANYFYIKDLNCQRSMLLSAYYSPFGNYILINAWNKNACLLDKDGNLIRTFSISIGKPTVRCVFSPDEKYLAVMSKDNDVEIFEVNEQISEAKPIATLKGHTELILGISFSQDSKKLLTVSKDGKALLWNDQWELEREIIEADKNYTMRLFLLMENTS